MLGSVIDRMESDIRSKTAAVRRDAFLVSQVVAAVGELGDFQRNVAIEKARDHLEAALRRARENPEALRSPFELLESAREVLDKARQKGAIINIPLLKGVMVEGNRILQRTWLAELDDVRRDRQTLTDLQSRLSSLTNDIDNALGEALGATFDYFRAGGQ